MGTLHVIMETRAEISETLQELLTGLLRDYDARVPEAGAFNDLRVKQQVYFGPEQEVMPGVLELAVMHMDGQVNASNQNLRFIAVRVKKSARGGAASSTALHGTREELKAALEQERKRPAILLDRVEELASGLPEETNPSFWR